MTGVEHIDWIDVLPSSELSAGTPYEVVVEEAVIILIRSEESIAAYQGLCPHQFARLAEGRVAEGYINCPRHMAKFRLSDGTCGPGWVLPPLRRYAVRENAGMIQIGLDRNAAV